MALNPCTHRPWARYPQVLLSHMLLTSLNLLLSWSLVLDLLTPLGEALHLSQIGEGNGNLLQ